MDACINLAGSHHLEDKAHFYREAARILKPGGRLVLADVETGTAADRFLTTFVDRHNSMGHVGVFLTPDSSAGVAACGFDIRSDEVISFPWSFASRDDMGMFCKLLFGMNLADKDTVIQAIEEILGFMQGPGKVNMAWSLRYVVAVCR